jgi:uncharacterized protein (TIGR00251 family)
VISVHETAEGVTFTVKVQPGARRNATLGELGDALKISLTAPPLDGRANEACIELLSHALRVPRSRVSIVSGRTSRRKLIRVTGITATQLRERLQL